MKKLNLVGIVVAALLFVSVHAGAAFAQEVTILGDASYPPYSYSDKGKPAGVYVDILTKAFEKIDGYTLTLKMTPWKRAIEMVKTGRNIAFFPPYFSEERTQWTTFSEPILPETTIVFGTEEKLAGKTQWPEDFFGSKVGLNTGFSPVSQGTQAFKDAIDAGNITLDDKGQKNEHNLKKLAAGRLDFYINDQMIDISAFPSIKRGIAVNQNNGYLGFTKAGDFPYLDDLKEKFDAVIKGMKASGEIDAIVKNYQK